MSARVVQRYVLDRIADDRLAVYVLWGPYKEHETEAVARSAAPFVPDPRAVHFWTETTAAGEIFQAPLQPLGLGAGSAWDSFLLYAPEARWGDSVPAPSSFMNRHVEGKPLNGARLYEQVRALLAAPGPR